jgi:hypothetical protein
MPFELCSERLVSLPFGRKRLLHWELSHRSDRFSWGMRHRFAGRGTRRIEISRTLLHFRFRFKYLLHQRQYRFSEILHGMGQRSFGRATQSVLLNGIAENKPATKGYGTDRGNGGTAPRPALCTRQQHASVEEASLHVHQSGARMTRRKDCSRRLRTSDRSQVAPMRAAHDGCIQRI